GVAVQDKKFQLTRPKVNTAFGYSLSDYEAIKLSVSVIQTVTVNSVIVVWDRADGSEISSASVAIGQLITAGQTLSYVYDESMGSSPNPPPGAATCSVVQWS
ncbi:MAG: hypothetical protein ACRDNZ_23230, partial [Streptosporangiaceae bacterium]